jgi:hypothetical protein
MTTYQDVFGGANIYPSEISYSELTLTGNVTLSWPDETSTSQNLATRIMDVTADADGYVITLPPANKAGNGETILFNNLGSFSFIVNNAGNVQVISSDAGEAWQVYLTDNSTAIGVWENIQYGAVSAAANASALAGTGIVAVGAVLSQSVPITEFNSDYTAGINDRAKMFVWTGAGGTFTLPSAPDVGDNWFCYLKNSGSGAILADPNGSPTIDGLSSLSFQPNESAIIATDGLNFFTIGFGQSATFAFDYTSINVAGGGDYTLSGSELNRIAYKLTGVLTADRNIIVPSTIQQYWMNNETTGAFVTYLKTAAGTPISIGQGTRGIFYCDGSNIITADSNSISYPISIANGGTGAVTAGGALINLGGGSTGITVFQSSTQAAVWTALGRIPSVAGGTF